MFNFEEMSSLSAFQRNRRAHLEHLRETAAAIGGIHRGLQVMYEGTGEVADDAFESLERDLEIPMR